LRGGGKRCSWREKRALLFGRRIGGGISWAQDHIMKERKATGIRVPVGHENCHPVR